MRPDRLLVPPKPGETIQIGLFTVEHRVCGCCDEPTVAQLEVWDDPLRGGGRPRFIVKGTDGELVAMAWSFRRLAHYRGWQLDPVEAWRRPRSWPLDRMNAWQKLCFFLARHDVELGDTAPPITRVHPECAGPEECEPSAPELAVPDEGPANLIQAPPLVVVERGEPDTDGQASLWT